MRIFISILLLAVASSKASHEGESDASHNSPSSGGFDYAPPHSFLGGAHGGQSHDFSASGSASNYGAPANDHTQAFTGGQGHAAAGSQDHSFPSFQKFQAHEAQPRGFDLGGHGDFSSSGPGNQADSYLKAVQDLGLSFGGHSSGGQGYSDEGSQGEGQSFGHGGQSFEHGGQTFGHGGQEGQGHQSFILEDGGAQFGHGDVQNHIEYDGGHDLGHGQSFGQLQDLGHGQEYGHGEDHAIPVGEHTDTEHPVAIPHYKHVTYPIPKTIHVHVPKPILVGVPQPYPVKVPVHKPVAVPVETEINIPVEKVVPYPVVKHIPYPVEKHVPIKVEKTVTVHVPHPYPVKIPVYKTIHHHKH